MDQPQPAMLVVVWDNAEMEFIPVQYNPREISFSKQANLAEISIPGLDSTLLQFVRGQNETLNVELFFDTTDQGMGEDAVSVTTLTDRIYQLVKIEPNRHAPPICEFQWNDKFPGCDVSDHIGNQRRNAFKCVIAQVEQRFTLFNSDGVPLRATLNVSMREYKTLDEQLAQLNLNSPDRTQVHVTRRGESLAAISARHYRRPGEWRRIAEQNEIEDPRRLAVGAFLQVPPAD